MAKLYICIVLVDIKNIFVKYSHCGPIHFMSLFIRVMYMGFLKQTSFTNRKKCLAICITVTPF